MKYLHPPLTPGEQNMLFDAARLVAMYRLHGELDKAVVGLASVVSSIRATRDHGSVPTSTEQNVPKLVEAPSNWSLEPIDEPIES